MTFLSIASSSVRYSLMETGSLWLFSLRKKSISISALLALLRRRCRGVARQPAVHVGEALRLAQEQVREREAPAAAVLRAAAGHAAAVADDRAAVARLQVAALRRLGLLREGRKRDERRRNECQRAE